MKFPSQTEGIVMEVAQLLSQCMSGAVGKTRQSFPLQRLSMKQYDAVFNVK